MSSDSERCPVCGTPRSGLTKAIALNAGLNVLVFKVVNETKDWKGSIRLTDSLGKPGQGIKVMDAETK